MNKNLIVTLADKRHIDAAKQFFSSLYHNSGWDEDVMLLLYEDGDKRFKEEDTEWFNARGIHTRKIDKIPGKDMGRLSSIALSKLNIFTEYFKRWTNVIFIDIDTIVTDSLDGLKNKKGFWASKCLPDSRLLRISFYENRNRNEFAYFESEYDINAEAFNSGVISFSTDMIHNNTINELLALKEKYKSIIAYQDQSILNLNFYRNWKKLSPIYNYGYGRVYDPLKKRNFGWKIEDAKKAIILHFPGDDKPWKKDNTLYPLWKNNLDKANKIDFNKPLEKERISLKKILTMKLRILFLELWLKFGRRVQPLLKQYKRIAFIFGECKQRLIKRPKEYIKKSSEKLTIKPIRLKDKIQLSSKPFKFTGSMSERTYEILINRNIGRVGKFIKRKWPKAYKLLRPRKKKNLLVVLANKYHKEAAKQVFASAYFHGRWNEDMMLMAHQSPGEKIPRKDLDEFKKKGIIVKRCRQLPKKYTYGFTKKVMFDTIYLFTKYFKRWDKIVYLDADIIIRSDIRKLKKIKGFGAMENRYPLWDQFMHEKRKSWKSDMSDTLFVLRKEYNLSRHSFNAGIFAFDTRLIKEATSKKLLHLLKTYKDIFYYRDQALYNLYFYDSWRKLPETFNFYTGAISGWNHPDANKGSIIHFLGPEKPWDKGNPFYEKWKENLNLFDHIRQDKSIKSRKILKSRAAIIQKYWRAKYRIEHITKDRSMKTKTLKKLLNIFDTFRFWERQ